MAIGMLYNNNINVLMILVTYRGRVDRMLVHDIELTLPGV